MKRMNDVKKNVVCMLVFLLLFLTACSLDNRAGRLSPEGDMTEGSTAGKGNAGGSDIGERDAGEYDTGESDTKERDSGENRTEGSDTGKSTAEGSGQSVQSRDPVENKYKSILSGNEDFICEDLENQNLNIKKIGQVITDDNSITVSVAKFAIIDLDGDGGNEMVLWLQINGISDVGFEILHDRDGAVYGYTLQYRSFMELKTDGTFTFSSSAADSGIGKLSFPEKGYNIDKQIYSQPEYDSNNKLTVQYFVNGESCSEGDFYNVMNVQDQKKGVEWYDLSADNINTVFDNLL